MAHLYKDLSVKSLYSDRKFEGGKSEWADRIKDSTTLYVGNLSFYTTEEQLCNRPRPPGLASAPARRHPRANALP